jgi:threonine/homoserine/homoserine lactone efflux protein
MHWSCAHCRFTSIPFAILLSGTSVSSMMPLTFLAGLMISLLNPQGTAVFMAMFSQVLKQDHSWPALALYGLTPVTIEFAWLSLVVLLLTRPAIQQGLKRIRHRLEGTIGVTLMAPGIKIGLG